MKLEIELLKMIKDGKLNPRNLKFEERMQIIDILRFEGLKNYEISDLLKMPIRTVCRYASKLNKRMAVLVRNATVEQYAGGLIHTATQLTRAALKKGDTELAWKIQTDLVAKLQDLGFVHREPQKIEMDVNQNAGDDPEQQRLLEQYEKAVYGTNRVN